MFFGTILNNKDLFITRKRKKIVDVLLTLTNLVIWVESTFYNMLSLC